MFGNQGNLKRCDELEESLIEYLDGRANPALRAGIENHLAGCAACRTRAEEFLRISEVLDDLPEVSPSPAFDASLRARIAAEPTRHNFWNWLPSPRLVLATAALIAVSVWVASVSHVKTDQADIAAKSAPAEIAKTVPASNEADFRMIRDLPVLENYDVVSKFDALSELPDLPLNVGQQGQKETR
jgi:anti-sigma factor RsiW